MAAHNNIKNIQFIIGKPDEALINPWSNILQAEEVVIIIDPPSNSKPRFYIDIIGDMNNLSKVIYLNSNSKSNVVKNLMSLTEAACCQFAWFRLILHRILYVWKWWCVQEV
ncbi:hypothetical protein WDU94_003394 [Cyamophila willieti]